MRFTEDELTYIDNIKWMKGSYVDFLRLWQPRYEDFEITTDSDCGLSIETFGTWLNTSMYEIPTLAIVNEVYFRMAYNYEELLDSFKKRLDEKYENLRSGHWYAGTFSEFGLRRRLSAEVQELAVEKFSHLNDTLHSPSKFVGTSNVYLAKKYNLTPVGTMAHEWIMCSGQGNHKHNPAYSNWYALDAWVREYGVLNGIALTDTITTDCFLKDFQLIKSSVKFSVTTNTTLTISFLNRLMDFNCSKSCKWYTTLLKYAYGASFTFDILVCNSVLTLFKVISKNFLYHSMLLSKFHNGSQPPDIDTQLH